MAINKRGDVYQARLSVRGRRVSASFQTRREAELWEARKRAEFLTIINSPHCGTEPQPTPSSPLKIPTLLEALEEAHEFHWRGMKAEQELVRNGREVITILGHDQPVTILGDQSSVHKVIRHYRSNGRSDQTINRKLAAYSLLAKRNINTIGKKPILPFTKVVNRRVRWVSHTEETTMLAWCDKHEEHQFKAFLIVALDTGMRLSEVLRMTPQDIYGNQVTTWVTKNGKARSIPLSSRAAVAAEQLAENPLTKNQIRTRWNWMRKAMGLANDEQFVIHALRHTFCTRLVRAGVSLRLMKELSGHQADVTAMGYLHLAEGDKRSAIDRLMDGS